MLAASALKRSCIHGRQRRRRAVQKEPACRGGLRTHLVPRSRVRRRGRNYETRNYATSPSTAPDNERISHTFLVRP